MSFLERFINQREVPLQNNNLSLYLSMISLSLSLSVREEEEEDAIHSDSSTEFRDDHAPIHSHQAMDEIPWRQG